MAQLGVLLAAHAGDEKVRVITRTADHRQHAAGARIESHDGPAAVSQCGTGGYLQTTVQLQTDVLPRHRRLDVQYLPDAPMRIGLYLLITHFAMQRPLIKLLDTTTSDELGSAVSHFIQLLQVIFRHPPHRSHRMGEQRAIGIVADLFRRDLHPVKHVPVHRQYGNLFFTQLPV